MGNRRLDCHRRNSRPCSRHPARREPVPVAGVRIAAPVSRTNAEDHLLSGDDHVVRRRARIENCDGRTVVLFPHRNQHGGGHAPDRPRADQGRQELPRVVMADGDQDLPACDARSDRQRDSPRSRRRHHRYAARGNQAVEPRPRLAGDPGLLTVRHAAHVCAGHRLVRPVDRRQHAAGPAPVPRRAARL